MPITRKTSERKKSEICKDENVKENIDVRQTVRESKVKALKKIEENMREESPRFTVKGKGDADAFDILCSSPLKQEVNFKPLSFWSKKVKDLECKENRKKKKFELYDLSETDDSSSVEGKRTKKRGRPPGRRPKNTGKKANKVPYHFNAKNLLKKKVEKTKVNENKEGSIIRERIILQRLNDNCLYKEDKFSFNKINAFGLTSTPERKKKLNIVGGSNFDFLSPIAICENKSVNGEMNFEKAQIKKSVVEENSQNKTLVTPKKSNKKGVSENVTKDLKGVSENELSRNVTLIDGYLEMDSFSKNFSRINSFSTINAESSFECSNVKTVDLHQTLYEENQMNITFLDIYEDEIEGEEDDVSHFRITDILERGCHDIDLNLNSGVSLNESDMLKSLISLKVLLKILCITFDCDIDTTVSSRSSFAASRFPVRSAFFHSMSQPLGEDKTNITNITDQFLDLGLKINGSRTKDSSVDSVHENIIRNSFHYVQVRRPCNFFLNFRGSAKEEETNLSYGEKVKNCEKQDFILQDIGNLDSNNDNARCRIIDSFRADSSTVNENLHNSSYSENKTCTIKSLLNEESTLMELPNRFEIEDQQTHMDNTPNFTLVTNSEMRSNQYRSKSAEVDLRGESKEMCFTLGNDSSIILSPEEDREDDVECSICKNKVCESRNCSKTETSPGMLKNPSENETTKVDSDLNNVTCFRVIGGLRQYKKQIKTEKSEESESDRSSLPGLVDGRVVKSAPVENLMSTEFTFNDESDFPLPIFESTACATPDAKKSGKISSKESRKDTEFNTVRVGEVSQTRDEDASELKIEDITSFHLKPGKKWARSAIILRKALNGTLVLDETISPKRRGRRFRTLVEEVLCMQTDVEYQNTTTSSNSVAAITNKMSNLTMAMKSFGNRIVKVLEEDGKENSFQSIFRNNSTFEKFHSTVVKTAEDCSEEAVRRDVQCFSARDLVLMRCNQEAPLPFEEYFNAKTLKNCKKIGEGTFGEVFMCNPNRVIKIMPIEGPDEVNGQPQKKFDEIITEMVIAMELSNLRHSEKYRTSGFSELKRCWCVIGEYPQYLIDLWNDFDCVGNGSENDSPEMFQSDQLYIILEFGNGGHDLEAFVFTSAEQSHSIFIQVAFSLAAAERILEFEHRDMHWGNILINHTREKYFKVTINGKEYKIPTKGVKVTIIDFTLSRITYEGCSIFNDLSLDPTLFAAEGDYQFEVYRMMKEEVMNDWSIFRPRTNLFWLHYVLDKMLTMVRYKKTDSKIHRIKLLKFSELKSSILDYRDSEDFILNNDLL